MTVGSATCTANIMGAGVCNIVVVQRVVNAALGQSSVTGSGHSASLTWVASPTPKYQAIETPENGYYTEESGMTQIDDIVGSVMKKLKDGGLDKNTIVVFSTDNGAENFTWPDGGNTPFAGAKGTILEGGMRVPAIIRWPDHVPAGKIENGVISGLDWFPTFVSLAGDPNIATELLQGKKLGDATYKVHLDGYDQTSLITGKGPSNRHEVFYFAEGTLGAVRIRRHINIASSTSRMDGSAAR